MAKSGAEVCEIAMENGARFAGKVFADATYEGDLMAQAKVSYTWGRESTAQYGETLAGVRDKTPKHQFLVNVNVKGPASGQEPLAGPVAAHRPLPARSRER